ncbi:hypothetical protein [Delftia acidovorans]|uniref:hypothetical protein n=1 Tax=Delftia acidovorans TaxID=80866 RepID=UPI00039F0083|nr:hypothetical protein [Delftia acidovorans]
MSENLKLGVEIDTKAAQAATDELRKKLQSVGNVKPQTGAFDNVNKQLQVLRTKAQAVGKEFRTAFGSQLTALLTGLRTALLAITAVVATVAAAVVAGFSAALKKGLGNNSALEDLHTSVASTVSSLYELRDASGAPLQGLERFQAAAAQAKERLEALRKETAMTGYAQKDLAAALNTGMGLGAAAGIDANSVQNLVRDISIAATAVGAAGEELTNEVKALFTGQGMEGSQLARALALDPQTLQMWKQQGTLAKELNARLADVKATAMNAEQGLGQLQGRLSNGINNALTKATGGAYETIKKSLAEVLDKLFDENGEVAPRYVALVEWATRLFDFLADAFGKGMNFVVDKLGVVSTWLKNNSSAFDSIGGSVKAIGGHIAGLLKPLSSVADGIEDSVSAGEMLVKVFEFVERIFASIVDVAKVAFGGIGTAIGSLGAAVGKMGAAIGDKLGIDKLRGTAESLADSSFKMMESSAATVRSGLTLEMSVATAAAISKRQHERALKLVKEMQVPVQEAEKKKKDEPAPNLMAKPNLDTAAARAEAERRKKLADAIAAAELQAKRLLFQDEQELLRSQLDKQVQLALVSKKKEIDERQKLDEAAWAFDLAEAKKMRDKVKKDLAAASTPEQAGALRVELVKIDSQVDAITRKGRVLKVKAELDKALLDKQIKEMAAQLQDELRQLQGTPEDLQAQRTEALKGALVQSDAGLQNMVNQVFDAKAVQQRFEAASAQVAAIHNALAVAEADIERASADMSITMLERESKLRDVRLQSAEALKAATEEMKKAADASGNKQLVAEAAAAAEGIKELDSKTRELEQRTVKGLRNEFASAFNSIATGAKSLSEGLLELFTSLLSRIASKFAERGFDELFKGAGGANASEGWLGSLAGFFGGAFATGGLIRGPGTGTSDQVPILASNGEFMMRAAVVKKHFSLLNYLNSTGNLPPMRAAGGPVDPAAFEGVNGGWSGTVQNHVSVSPQVVIDTGHVIEALARDPRFENLHVKLAVANRRRSGV